jgi:Permuted papain-like amidase enzyme, YaeF/YiiX, C92 family
MQKFKKYFIRILIILVALYLLLLIPDSEKQNIVKAADKPFAWNQDSVWNVLEMEFKEAKNKSKSSLDTGIQSLFEKETTLLNHLQTNKLSADDSTLQILLTNYFHLAALVAAQPRQRDSFVALYNHVRNAVKQQSQSWDIDKKEARNSVYQLLYGMRAATEEVLLQTDSILFAPAINVKHETSVTPYTSIFGISVHSGDLLVSRGGAEVSAMISRGNNYPGNFSHVALIYVEEKTNQPYLTEAHIEKGVAVASAEQYVKDKKLRFMVLRPRADLPALKNDPMLPHKAAKLAYEAALSRHIPYDFKMNFYDSTALFCSEVGSYAYKKMGIQLWQAVSTISSQGVVNWLSDFGVENFVTQMPSDLEYDPQLSVVAEWRNPETLMKDHLDNAVMDALLEQADKGKQITYAHWQLPFVRMVKLWCIIKNKFGGVGIIPEGMSATQALKNQTFVALYNNVRTETQVLSNQFIKEHQYKPPYWQLVAMARSVAEK